VPAKLLYTGPSLGTLHEEYAKKSRIDEQAADLSGQHHHRDSWTRGLGGHRRRRGLAGLVSRVHGAGAG
jgi:hypothetical protein